MPIEQFGGLPPGLSMDVLRQLYSSIFGGSAPTSPPIQGFDYRVSPSIDPGIIFNPDQPGPSATPYTPDTTPQGPYQYNIPPNPFGYNSGGGAGGAPPMSYVSQTSDTGGGEAWSEPTPIPGTFGSNLAPDFFGYPPEFEPSPTPTATPTATPPPISAGGFDPSAYGSLSTGPAFLTGDIPGGTPAPYDPYAGASDPLMGQPDVPTAPGVTPDVAPAQALSPDVAAAQPTFPINWASPQAIPPGQPGSNLGGPQGPMYATPPSVSPFQAFMNWLGNIPQNISSLIGNIPGPEGRGGFGQPAGYFGVPSSPPIGQFGVNAPGFNVGGGISLSDIAASGVAPRATSGGVPAPGGWGGTFGQGSAGTLGTYWDRAQMRNYWRGGDPSLGFGPGSAIGQYSAATRRANPRIGPYGYGVAPSWSEIGRYFTGPSEQPSTAGEAAEARRGMGGPGGRAMGAT